MATIRTGIALRRPRTFWQRLWHFLQREQLYRLGGLVLVLMFLSAVGLSWFEPEISFGNALWWSLVTLTTVGYGDVSPATMGGRIIAVTIMLTGIGVLGMCSATIATMFVVKSLKEERGMSSFTLTDHIILCVWNVRARTILQELREEPQTAQTPIVLIADMEQKPLDDDLVFFVQGAVNDDTLRRANLPHAKTVVILGQDSLEVAARDAQVILATLTVESINPNVYTIVELVDPAYIPFCERAHANEIIVGNELSSLMISRATLHHGMSKVVSELLSVRYGNEFYTIAIPATWTGRPFLEVFLEMKQLQNSIILAVQHGEDGAVRTNPPGDYVLAEGDTLIVVAQEAPQLR